MFMVDKNDLHPIRLTYKQVGFLKHAIDYFFEYFEEEAAEFFEAVEASEENMTEEEKKLIKS
jgi:hypothetical protein